MNHVLHRIDRVSTKLIDEMKNYPSATIHEAYGGRGALPHFIKPIRPGMRICGPVVPVAARPGDNLIVHKAIYTAEAGDVLLVDTSSFLECGFWGEVMTVAARARGITGLVTDGATRDSEQIAAMDFPVFCQALSIKGSTKTCPGRINYPILFHGVWISPGDLIVGDADGVVIVARKDVPEVLEQSRQREEKENAFLRELKNGKTTLELYGFTAALEREGIREE